MITADPSREFEMMHSNEPKHTSKDYVAESASNDSAWEKVPGTSMYRCTKCMAQEVKMSRYCPDCGRKMSNFG